MSPRNIWTPAEDATLLRLRDAVRADWDTVAAALPGRTVYAIRLRYYKALQSRSAVPHQARKPGRPRRDKVVALARSVPAPPPAPVVAAPVVPAPLVAPAVPVDKRRRYITEALREAAELRARIALQGVTAGLLGDPLPGRSALDARLARLRGGGNG